MPTKRRFGYPEPGERFGHLTIVRPEDYRDPDGHTRRGCVCRCDCGKTVRFELTLLLRGKVLSCGYHRIEGSVVSHRKGVKGAMSNNRSGYKGVCYCPRTGGWLAQITANGVKRTQRFDRTHSAAEAARWYDAMAIEMRGDSACINFPEDYPGHPNRKPARRIGERGDVHAH